MGDLQRLGGTGEDAAAAYLVRLGYRILARNWRTRLGEIDIVAVDGGCLVFVEVKLRYGDFDPLEAVDEYKQRHISRVALDFLCSRGALETAARFDVVAVDGDTLACTHVVNAFDCAIDY